MSNPEQMVLPAGLELLTEAITPEQEVALLAACAQCDLRYYEQDPDNPRSRKQFGWYYDFATDGFLQSDPVPDAFAGICAQAAAFTGVEPEDIIDTMVIRYEPGSYIQPHCDKPVFDRIVGLSLGADCDMVFSKPEELGGDTVTVTLPRRSMFQLSGDARFVYRHGIPLVTHTRWSMTFRTLTAAGEALRASFAR